MTRGKEKFDCERATAGLKELGFYFDVFQSYKREGVFSEAYKSRDFIGRECLNQIERFDPHLIVQREIIARKLGLKFLGPIQSNGLAVGDKGIKQDCFLVDTKTPAILPVRYADGEEAKEPIRYISKFRENRAIVYFESSGNWLMIDETGRAVTDVMNGRLLKISYVDDQQFPIMIDEYEDRTFPGDARTMYKSSLYLTADGREIGENKHQIVTDNIFGNYHFSDGVAWGVKGDSAEEIYLMDEAGQELLSLSRYKYEKISLFIDGQALVVAKPGGSFWFRDVYIIDKQGKRQNENPIVIATDSLASAFSDEAGFFHASLDGAPLLFNRQGFTISGKEKNLIEIQGFKDGYANVKTNAGYALMDTAGNFPFPKLFGKYNWQVGDGMAVVQDYHYQETYHLIDLETKEFVNLSAKDKIIDGFENGVAKVEMVENDRPVGKYLIDKKGRDILKGKRYQLIHPFKDGLAYAGDSRGSLKLIDNRGRERFKIPK